MSSRTSTFRFKSLSKTMDNKPKQLTSEIGFNQSLKLPAINSVFKGVKYNDISMLSGRELKKLRKDPENSVDLQFQSAHENLKSMRKKFDKTKTNRIQTQAKVNSLMEQVQKFRAIQHEFQQKKDGGKASTSILHSQLLSKKLQFEQADIEKKVMLNAVTNHHKDKIVYAQRIYDLEKQLKFLKKQLKIFDTEGKSFFQGEDRAKKLANTFLQQLNQQENQRQEHIKSLEQQIAQKKKVNEANAIRAVQMQQIAELAMQDKGQNQKKWEKLFLAHTFVASMLRNKMYREMEKFNVVETAFKNIKIATGIIDSNTLIHKFLNKQTVYGQLLGKIAQNQGRISHLKLQAEQLQKQHKHLQEAQKELVQMRRKESSNLTKQIKILETIEERKTNVDLLQGKIKNWLWRNMKKFKGLGQEVQEVKSCSTLPQLKQELQRYLSTISKNLDSIVNSMNPQEQISVFEAQEFSGKINRIKVGKTRKNSVGQEITNHFQEEDKNQNEQLDALENDRTQMIKANEKFLKEVRQKYLQIRKAKMQAMPKQKKKEPQKKQVIEEN